MAKKWIGVLAAFCVLFTLAQPAASAVGEGKLIVGTGDIAAGYSETVVDVPITIENNPGISTVMFHVEYPEELVMVSKPSGGLIEDMGRMSSTLNSPYIVDMGDDLSTTNITDDGVLVTLHFQVKAGTAAGTYPISVSTILIYDAEQLEELPFTSENGSITVKSADTASEEDGGEISSEAIESIRKKCYVATSVYGSYDCPQVWTLRRFRDETLAETWYGRMFIKAYYAVSPAAVKLFGNSSVFQNFFRPRLDKMVNGLQAKGVSSSRYADINW